MSTQELIAKENITPSCVAADLLAVIQDIELCVENANDHVSRIENRNVFKSLFSSDRTDLIDISKSQNKINEMMLGLIQEAITLNTMSYSFLAAVISELERRAKDGWTDAEGNFQHLSDIGKNFAGKATVIFQRIAEGSRHTQGRIELNEANIEEINQALAANEKEVSDIQQMLSEKAERLAAIDALLDKKSALDNEQSQAIQAIVQELKENSRLDQDRAKTMERLAQDLKSLCSRLADLESRSSAGHLRLRLGLSALAAATVMLAGTLVASLAGYI